MIDYDLVKLMHRHGDAWAALEPVERDGREAHHSSAAHDLERSPERWARVYRCTSCAEEFALGTGDAAAPEGGATS
jgi:hypothetical protein